ncbi:MAG: mononuclear molybdenum enzyme YedY, partial [Gammaproteobacteria bacterium]
MLIRLDDPAAPAPSEITPEAAWLSRRELLAAAVSAPLALLPQPAVANPATSAPALVRAVPDDSRAPAWLRRQVGARRATAHRLPGEMLTPYRDVSTYNNFYEFGTAKTDPAENAKSFVPFPWTVRIDGEVARPGDYTLE